MGYYMDLSFYCPRRNFDVNIYKLRCIAEQNGLGFEVRVTREFRNAQRLGTHAKEALVRFYGNNRARLESVVRSVYFT